MIVNFIYLSCCGLNFVNIGHLYKTYTFAFFHLSNLLSRCLLSLLFSQLGAWGPELNKTKPPHALGTESALTDADIRQPNKL